MDAIGDERRCQRVALMTGETSAVKGEIERRRTVDETALGETEAGHQGLPFLFCCTKSLAVVTAKISCVWVSRSTTSHERHPPPWCQYSLKRPLGLSRK